MHQHIQRKKNR